eukprot:scaffold8935_cov69-Phaeocystis_antarctica.AAC.4
MRQHRVDILLPYATVYPGVAKHLAAAAGRRDLVDLLPREHRVRLDADLVVGKGARKLALRSKLLATPHCPPQSRATFPRRTAWSRSLPARRATARHLAPWQYRSTTSLRWSKCGKVASCVGELRRGVGVQGDRHSEGTGGAEQQTEAKPVKARLHARCRGFRPQTLRCFLRA